MEGRGAAKEIKVVTLWPLRAKLQLGSQGSHAGCFVPLLLVRLFFVGGPLQNFSSAAVFLRNKINIRTGEVMKYEVP